LYPCKLAARDPSATFRVMSRDGGFDLLIEHLQARGLTDQRMSNEASPTLARLASTHCGLPVEVRRFQAVDWENAVDGMWDCASPLHVPMAELPEVLWRLGRALKPDGVRYTLFK
jgi:hypothetical protein